MAEKIDAHDGDPWSEIDLRDLRGSLASGNSIEEAATFLCRQGTIDDVRAKADELGLAYHSRPPGPDWPTHKITTAEVIMLDSGRYGVRYAFDDGASVISDVGSKEEAEFSARDRIGDPVAIVNRERF